MENTEYNLMVSLQGGILTLEGGGWLGLGESVSAINQLCYFSRVVAWFTVINYIL